MAGEVYPHSTRSLLPEVVLGAEHTLYLSENFSQLPMQERKGALELLAERKSPWPHYGKAVVWRGAVAQLWLWPAELAGKVAAVPIPETLLKPRLGRAGLQLVECQRGYLLQHWGDTHLLAETWLPARPDGSRLAWSCRSRGLAPIDPDRLIPVSDTLPGPWKGFRRPLPAWVTQRKSGVGWVAALIAVLALTLPITSGLKAQYLADQYQQELEQARAEASELLAMRGQARRDAYQYRQLSAALNVPDPLASQWLIIDRLPGDLDFEVVQWERQGDQAQLVIRARLDDSFEIVSAMAGPGVADVKVEPWRRDGHHAISLRFTRPPVATLADLQNKPTGEGL